MSDAWNILGLAPVRDRDAIRRAYARRLKVTSPEDDPEGFMALRSAYEHVLASLEWDWAWEDGEADESPVLLPLASGDGVEAALALDARFAAHADPTPPAGVSRLHAPLLAHLEDLLHQSPPPPAATVEAAFDVLMASPALDEVAIQADVETRVLALILDNIPRSDPLVRPAINAFDWSRTGVISRRDAQVDTVLDRDSDIVFRKGLAQEGTQLRGAYKALSTPPDRALPLKARLWPGLSDDVAQLLREVDVRRPSLAADFDAAAYAWWRGYQSRPHLPSWLRLAIVGLPILALVIALADNRPAGWTWLIAQAAAIAFAAAYLHAYARPRRWWLENWSWRAPPWARTGWTPASFVLILAAAMAPAGPIMAWVVLVLGAVIVLWSLITGEPDRREGNIPWLLRVLMSQAYLLIWWGALVFDGLVPTQMWLSAGVAITVAMTGGGTLIDFWYGELTARARRTGLILAMLCLVLSAVTLAESLSGPSLAAPFASALVTVLVLSLRPAGVALEGVAVRIRHYVMWFGLIGLRSFMHLSEDGPVNWLAIGGYWLLAGVAITLFYVTPREFGND